jgi:hypothetical protein
METNTYTTVAQPLNNGYSTVEYLLPNGCLSVHKELINHQNAIFTRKNQQLGNGWLRVGELSKKSLPMHIHIHRHRDIHIHRDMDNSRRGNTRLPLGKKVKGGMFYDL